MTVETLVHSEHESSMGMGSISSQRRELKDDVAVKNRREELNLLMPNSFIINTLEDVLGPWSGCKQLQVVDNTGTIYRHTWVNWGSGSRWLTYSRRVWNPERSDEGLILRWRWGNVRGRWQIIIRVTEQGNLFDAGLLLDRRQKRNLRGGREGHTWC
jgi:hypothetical protein